MLRLYWILPRWKVVSLGFCPSATRFAHLHVSHSYKCVRKHVLLFCSRCSLQNDLLLAYLHIISFSVQMLLLYVIRAPPMPTRRNATTLLNFVASNCANWIGDSLQNGRRLLPTVADSLFTYIQTTRGNSTVWSWRRRGCELDIKDAVLVLITLFCCCLQNTHTFDYPPA